MTAVRRLKPAYGAAGRVAGHKLTGLARRSIRRRLGNLPERGRYVTTWRSVFQHLVSPLSGRNLYGDYGGNTSRCRMRLYIPAERPSRGLDRKPSAKQHF
jgi:hypothetical protein